MYKPSIRVKAFAQGLLNQRTGSKLQQDGIFGAKSVAAAKKFLDNAKFKGDMTPDRWCAAVIQLEGKSRDLGSIVVDGFYGPNTEDAAHRMLAALSGKKEYYLRPDEYASNVCPTAPKTIVCRNPSTAEFISCYGKAGTNQAMVKSPYPLIFDWDLSESTTQFSAHKSLVSRIECAMQDVLDHYGLARIQKLGLDRFGGCLNVRPKRGGTTPSVHSWGAAIDWFPSKNQLKQTKSTALFAKADYVVFMEIWERHGFMSLGRCFDFDWMHVQANPE